jgi:putative ABC transport system substrate-binding protein
MNRRDTVAALLALGAAPLVARAQPRVYRVGAIHMGGPLAAAVDGLRDGLRELGLEDGKQILLHVRDTKGDLKSVAAAAKNLEGEKVDLIFSVATSVTLAVKQATKSVPIVFFAATDPVAFGLVESYRKPGGRLTGIHGRVTDLTAKRLQLLKEMIPGLRRVVTFYNLDNPTAQQGAKNAREAARQLKVEFMERPIASVEELQTGLRALRPGEADAFFYLADSTVNSQSEFVIATATAKRLPMMHANIENVAKGALAAFGVSYYAMGQLAATHVQRILLGANPGNLPVEQVDRLHFAVNLKTAKALGLTIPPSVLVQADEIIR